MIVLVGCVDREHHAHVGVKAANALRDWSSATRAELAAGKEAEIPGIGKFVEVSGLIRFVANPHFQHTPPPVPMLKMSKRLEEQPDFRREAIDHSDDRNSSPVAWGKVGIIAILVLVLALGGYFAYRYFSEQSTTTEAVKPADSVVPQQAPPVVTPMADTGERPQDSAMNAAPAATAAPAAAS